jgi:hypothetical protein
LSRWQRCRVERLQRAQVKNPFFCFFSLLAAAGFLRFASCIGALVRFLLPVAVGAGFALRAIRAQVKPVTVVAETGAAAVLERRKPALVEFARQPRGDCAVVGS